MYVWFRLRSFEISNFPFRSGNVWSGRFRARTSAWETVVGLMSQNDFLMWVDLWYFFSKVAPQFWGLILFFKCQSTTAEHPISTLRTILILSISANCEEIFSELVFFDIWFNIYLCCFNLLRPISFNVLLEKTAILNWLLRYITPTNKICRIIVFSDNKKLLHHFLL